MTCLKSKPHCGAAWVLALCLTAGGCRQSETYHGVEIVGSEKFSVQIRDALALIRSESPDEFELIATYVKRVEEHERSGMDSSRQTCQLAPASTYYSLTWCAGCIAHEAHHAKLASEPSYSYGHAKEELACNAFQMAVLRNIGAPERELQHLAAQDGSHFDRNGDGEYTWDDYEERNW